MILRPGHPGELASVTPQTARGGPRSAAYAPTPPWVARAAPPVERRRPRRGRGRALRQCWSAPTYPALNLMTPAHTVRRPRIDRVARDLAPGRLVLLGGVPSAYGSTKTAVRSPGRRGLLQNPPSVGGVHRDSSVGSYPIGPARIFAYLHAATTPVISKRK